MKICGSDIHSHILPGVDDGFRDAGDSLEALSRMAAAGCKEFTFTPHLNPELFPGSSESTLRERYKEFAAMIPESLGVKTSLAAEYMVVNGFERKVAGQADGLLHFDDGSILIEMSYYYRSRNLEDTVFELNMAGLRPILAHPERYAYMSGCLGDFDRLRDMGCRFQINYMSLTGMYGAESVKILRYLNKRGWCDSFSSDLHSLPQLDKILSGKIILPLWKFRKLF